MKCPNSECGSEDTDKVISFALPLKLCHSCNTVWGEPFATIHWWFLAPIEACFSEGFYFMSYEGTYFDGLLGWLFGEDEE